MKKTVITLLIFLCIMSVVIAPPPFQQSEADEGLILEAPIIEVIKQNQDFEFHIHVINFSNGYPFFSDEIDDCVIHLYSPVDGEHIIETVMGVSGNGIDFSYNVGGGNFSVVGQYAALFSCNYTNPSGEVVGGFIEYPFMVTPTGEALTTGSAIVYMLMLFGSVLFFCFTFYWMIAIKWGNFIDYEAGEIATVNDWKYLKLFLMPVNYVMLMWIFGLARSIAANYLHLPGLGLMLNWAYWIMLSFAFPLLIVGLWFLFLSIINDKKINDSLKRGSPYNGP